jgi:hypothetical protein
MSISLGMFRHFFDRHVHFLKCMNNLVCTWDSFTVMHYFLNRVVSYRWSYLEIGYVLNILFLWLLFSAKLFVS